MTNPWATAPAAPQQPQYAPPAPQQYAPPAAPQMDPQYAAFLAQQQAPQYAPPAQYGPPAMAYAPPAPPVPELAKVDLSDFLNQPSVGGGDSWKFETLGQSHVGQVARELTSADFQQQTNDQGVGQTFKDGRPKVIMTVPVIDAETGQPARWIVGGQRRDALTEAMRKAGADPSKTPEAGAWIKVTYVSNRANRPPFGATHVMEVEYSRPSGAAPAPSAPVAAQPAPQVAPPAPVAAPQYAAPAPAPVTVPGPVGVPAPTAEQLAVLQSLGIPIPGQ